MNGMHDAVMAFLQEDVPPRGVALSVLPGIRRVVAENPGVMTYHGTNTYLIDEADGITVIDPGPESAKHVRDVLAAAGGKPITRLVLTHTHGDHCGAVPELSEHTGAPVYAYRACIHPGIRPDFPLEDNSRVGGLTALHTPGHAADHLCFEYYAENGQKILFSGDHVMSWSSSIVSPPDGDMLDYYRSLERLLGRDDDIYLSGHGPLLTAPRALVADLLSHRQYRERTIVAALEQQDWAVAALAARLYNKSDLFLKGAAQRNVLAHILKLKAEGVVEEHAPDTEPHPDTVALMRPLEGVRTESGGDLSHFYTDSLRRFGLRSAA
jgi:glyoxylase-like metal-dependent hydrolase (beta-lactamase superfamily II)